jgi:predicted PhzF superfamily epimerase YddE/YHI9
VGIVRHCYVVRVFTDAGAGGNPLGVIPDSSGLSDAARQSIAADLGFSETVFIEWPAGDVPTLRIFTPAVELPFAGHPLVGTAWVLNEMGPGAARMQIQIGEVRVASEGDDVWVIPPSLSRDVVPEAVDAGLGVGGERAWRVRVPSEYLVLEVGSSADVEAARPILDRVREAADGLYLVAGRNEVRARFFAPRLGVDEDPATGSAAVALAAIRSREGDPAGSVQIAQGLPDHLSRILLTWDGDEVRLGGSVEKDEVRVLDV